MRKIASFVFIFVLLSASLYSQSADTVKNEPSISRNNKWALQFQAGYNFQVQAFNGMTISLKYHITEKSGFRLGLGYYGQIEKANVEHYQYSEIHTYNQEYYYYNFTGVLNYIYYINPFSRFNVYWGIGPTGKYSYSYDKYPYYSLEDYTDIYCSSQWSAGLSGVFGVEWIPVSDFSIFAEYEAAGYYGKFNKTTQRLNPQGYSVEKYDSEGEKWSFEGNKALLGISIYFSRFF